MCYYIWKCWTITSTVLCTLLLFFILLYLFLVTVGAIPWTIIKIDAELIIKIFSPYMSNIQDAVSNEAKKQFNKAKGYAPAIPTGFPGWPPSFRSLGGSPRWNYPYFMINQTSNE